MSKSILTIQSSARLTDSISRQFTAQVADVYKEAGYAHVERDLEATELPFVSEQMIGAYYTPADERSDAQKALLETSDALVAELQAADVIAIGAPVYNFSVPARLKAWIDLICRAGVTFQYTENGPEGLLKNKKAYIVLASGGVAAESAADFVTPYLKQVLAFVGITDVTLIAADTTALDMDAAIAKASKSVKALQAA
jgi:FMN-dependent NADH-azoreductase